MPGAQPNQARVWHETVQCAELTNDGNNNEQNKELRLGAAALALHFPPSTTCNMSSAHY